MTYREIKECVLSEKDKHHTKHMTVTQCGRFSVMKSEVTDYIIVDNDVAEMVSNRRWCIDSCGYPVANIGGTLVRLFDFVMSLEHENKPKRCYVDHINHDKLDNRRTNLRFASPTESSMNMPLRSKNTTGKAGVSRTKYGNYRAYITYNRKQVNLGYYNTLDEAIAARVEGEERFGYYPKRGMTIEEKCNLSLRQNQN